MLHSHHLTHLSSIVGEKYILTSAEETEKYVNDWRGRYSGSAMAVLMPKDTQQICAIMAYCHLQRIKVIPQGGNTSLCGGSTPDSTGSSLIINLSRLNTILDFDPLNRHIRVESGCTLAQVHEYLQDSDLIFPLDLASAGSCQIGGNISTNAGGIHVIRYGNMRDLTLGIEVVLADGQVWSNLNTLRKVSCGYDLKHCFIGAEGSLGIITSAVLKLYPQPKFTYTAWLSFTSITQSIDLLNHLLGSFGEAVSAFELMSLPTLQLLAKHYPGIDLPVLDGQFFVLCELRFFSQQEQEVEQTLVDCLERNLLTNAVLAQSEQQRLKMWQCRETIPEAQKRNGFNIKHDIAIPLTNLAQFLQQCEQCLLQQYPDLQVINFGHLGDGSLHYNLSFKSADNARIIAEEEKITSIVHDWVNKFAGTISAEHGIGRLNRHAMARYKSPIEINLMRQIKNSLDPCYILNPGVIFE